MTVEREIRWAVEVALWPPQGEWTEEYFALRFPIYSENSPNKFGTPESSTC